MLLYLDTHFVDKKYLQFYKSRIFCNQYNQCGKWHVVAIISVHLNGAWVFTILNYYAELSSKNQI